MTVRTTNSGTSGHGKVVSKARVAGNCHGKLQHTRKAKNSGIWGAALQRGQVRYSYDPLTETQIEITK